VDLHPDDNPGIHLTQKSRRFLKSNVVFNLHRSAFTTISFGYYDIPARSERGKITNANHAKIIFATKKKAREAIHKTRNSRIKFMN